MRAILDIPYIDLLIDRPLSFWVKRFKEHSGYTPTEIVLPAVNHHGPIFKTDVAPMPGYMPPNLEMGQLIEEARREFPDVTVWALINMTLGFLGGIEELRVTDHLGINLDRNLCMVNEVVQKRVKRLINDIMNYDVDGITFDLTDIFPQSASNVVQGKIQNTCFCEYCLEGLEEEGWSEGKIPFVQRDIQRVALQATETGTSHITVDLHGPNPQQNLLMQSYARRFVDQESDTTAERAAIEYLDYLKKRVKLTNRKLKELGDVVRSHGKRSAAITGDSLLDLTTMTDLVSLSEDDVVSEVWVGNSSRRTARKSNLPVVLYLHGRATYIIQNFFELFYIAEDTIKLRGEAHFKNRLLHISRRLMGANVLDPANCNTIQDMDWLEGFVGFPLINNDDLVRLLNSLLVRLDTEILPADIFEPQRNTEPEVDPRVLKMLLDRMRESRGEN